MANKMTQKQYFEAFIEVFKEIGRDDLVAFCEDRIEKLGRKSTSKKPTKTQVENEGIKDTILEVLGEVSPATATMIATDPRVNVSNQKVSSLLTQLRKEGLVKRTEEKGKAYFSLGSELEESEDSFEE